MAYLKFPIQPGVFKDDTPLSAKTFAIDSDKMRVVRGRWQTIGGWETAANDTFMGVCRGLFSWRDGDSQSYTAIGTHTALEVFYDGAIYDITPAEERGQLTNPFSTTISTYSVNVADTAHGRAVDDRVVFANATAVGGITVDGEYTVTTVVDANNYTITSATVATSTAGPGGGTVDYEYLLKPGLVDNLGGPGYGVGVFGTGGYGQGSSETVYYPRTWTMDSWGQNLVACPRGGKIYEWAPNFSDSNVVTNGTFTTDTAWTKGTGWTIPGGAGASGAAGSASDLSQALTLTPGAYYLLDFDYTRSAGTLQPKIGSTSIGSALSSATGHVKEVFFAETGSLIFYKDASFIGTVDNVVVSQMVRAHPIPNAPTENTCIWVTAERILTAAGTQPYGSTVFNPLLVRWSDQDDNQQWTPAPSNQSGELPLAKGGRVVAAIAGRGENYVWSDKGMYTMRYVPDPNVIYSFNHTGAGCGPISAHGVMMLAGNAYWMANTGEFFRYTGSAPEPLFCTVRKDVFDNLAPSQGEKVYAFANSAFKEVGWLYPDFRDGNECSRYVKYNVAENCFDVGTFDRTAWIDSGGSPLPMAAGIPSDDTANDAVLYYQEKGNSADGAPLSWSLRTGAFDLDQGGALMRVISMIPDMEDFLGGCSVTVMAYLYPASTARETDFTINSSTTKASFRTTGRQVELLFEGSAAPAFARFGESRLDVRPTGMTR